MSNCFILLAAGKGKRFKANSPKKFTNVFIHDAARPNFSIRLLKKLN